MDTTYEDQELEDLDHIFEELNSTLKQTEEIINDHLSEYEQVWPESEGQKDLEDQPAFSQSVYSSEAETQTATEDMPADDEDINQGIAIETSEDNLEAYLYLKHTQNNETSLDLIRNLLYAEGIRHGVIENEDLKQYIVDPSRWAKPFLIAQGNPPQESSDYDIHYYFETDPIKIGTERSDGSIDFKERGKIPFIKKGEIVAEKLSGKTGNSGIDIYGNEIPVSAPKKLDFYCGKGVRKSEDGLKVYATVDGQPGITAGNKLFVLPGMNISGDVDFETGHIDFDGHVNVQGTVRSGFNVRSGSLTAQAIEKSEIETEGNITVYGGIVGATIKTAGNVKASHLHLSEIAAFGDVNIENEICNCSIENNGKVFSKFGQIANSFVCAKKGIEAQEVGSEVSKPCTLVIGNECEKKQQKLQEMRERLAVMKAEQEPLVRSFVESQKVYVEIHKELDKQSVQLKSLSQQKAYLEAKFQQFKDNIANDLLMKGLVTIKTIGTKIQEEQDRFRKLVIQQKYLQEKIAAERLKIENIKNEFNELRETIKSFIAAEKEEGIPAIKVYGKIFEGTFIRGKNTSYTFNNTCKRLRMKELKIRDRRTKELKWTFVKQHV